TNTSMTINPVDIGTTSNFLGKSQFADPYFAGRLDDVQFLPHALTDAKVAAMMTNTPPVFISSTISGGNATQGVAYSGTLIGKATDTDAGDTLIYSKVEGPAWLTVAANGALTGLPSLDDEGIQEFLVQVTDSVGATAVALLTINLPPISGNGTWIGDANGIWSDTSKWSGGFPANAAGYTADFSTLNISADRIVTLNTSRKIGTLRFGDAAGTQSWTLAAAGGRTLTLETTSGTPAIVVNQNTATLSVPLSGTAGFTKSGPGILILQGDNTLSGTINIDTGSSSANEGSVRLAHPNAVADVATIAIRSNNGGRSTLEFDGSSGNIIAPTAIALSGRNNTTPAISNLSGSNTVSGEISLYSGGSSYIFQSEAGALNLTGVITSGAGGTRTLTFQGNGNVNVSGSIQNGASTVLALTKVGTGTLTLSGANTYTGSTTLSAGTLVVNGNIAAGSTFTAAGETVITGSGTIHGGATINGTHSPGNGIGTQTFGATLAYGGTARLKWELGSNSVTIGTFDRVTASGSVSIANGAVVDLTLDSGTVALNNAFWTQPRNWTILTAPSISGSFTLGNISADSGWRSASNYGTFALQQSAIAVILSFTPHPPKQVWQRINFGENWSNASIAGDMADRDQDGLPNLLEYVLGSDPNATIASAAPQMLLVNGKLAITFTRNVTATDVTFSVLGSDNPAGPWTELARSANGSAFTVTA
ncbi:MAG: hypothetical protein EOP84_15610, partial [Verrucomicrobiaceae bacterium]